MREAAPTQCVILVGGLGTRLGTVTSSCPKPLLPIAGRPFLETLCWHVARFGFDRLLLLAGVNGEAIVQYACGSPYRDRLAIEVQVEPSPLGTAGALRAAADRLDTTFFLLNGDSVFDFNWLDLVDLLTPATLVSMSLRSVEDASRFGTARLDNGRVVGFSERGGASGGIINGGVYCMRREVVAACPQQGSFERDVLPTLVGRDEIRGRIYTGFFHDIGLPESYAAGKTLIPASLRRPAIIFDRDGVLNFDHGYVSDWNSFEWMPSAIEAVKLANDSGYFSFMVTNQAGIARGYYDENALNALHQHMRRTLRNHGAHFDDIRSCPHHPEGIVPSLAITCSCRKPAPGMILDLIKNWPIDASRSLLIGDKPTDVEAGERAGIKSVLFDGSNLEICLREALQISLT